jgi:threonine synthase
MTSTNNVASQLTHIACSICDAAHDPNVPQTICTGCGRALEARYDLDAAKATLTLETVKGRVASLWRYAEVLPAVEAARTVTLGEGMTPLNRAPRLGAHLNLSRLLIKDEGGNPTGSFKARGIVAAMAKAVELGITDVGMPTAGNAGAATAAYAARAGLTAHVAMPADTPRSIIDETRAYGAEVTLVDGLISDAGKLIARGCAEHGWFNMSTLKEPYRLEGKKTMGYELWEQFGGELPDVIFYPTGGGTGLIGMWKAFGELERMGLWSGTRPRMIAVQAEGCAPIVRAFEAGRSRAEPWQNAATIAPGIRVPSPFADDLILAALKDSQGTAIAVTDIGISNCIPEIAKLEGIDACPEGAATLAGLRQALDRDLVGRDERIVLFNTGSGLKHPELRPA